MEVYVQVSTVLLKLDTVFIRIVAAATINFALSFVRLLFEGGYYSNKYGMPCTYIRILCINIVPLV